jgi:murein L,D-transpeptidase YafK
MTGFWALPVSGGGLAWRWHGIIAGATCQAGGARHGAQKRLSSTSTGASNAMKLRALFILFFLGLASTLACAQPSFLAGQMKFARVRDAMAEKSELLKNRLAAHGLKTDDFDLLIVAYKAERILELHAKKRSAQRYEKLASYPICALSGSPGPKRAQGDFQIPEGFYRIDRFNPASAYHLSLGIDYPNRADRIKSRAANLGGDIFIHGDCVTIGCLPMTDDKIREIYLYAVHARNNGQTRIPVYIFPFRMQDATLARHATRHRNRAELLVFWNNLKKGYDKFTQDKQELDISITQSGDYRF